MKQLSTAEIRDDLRELLSQTPLFAQCSDTLHDFIIDSADLRQYEASEVIVESDTQSESYSIIVRGEAKVKLSDGAVVGELSATDGFGEIGLLLDENRSASVIANELVLILTLAKPQFEECFIKFPEFGRRIAEVLAQRLSSTLQLVPSIGEQHFESESGVLSLLPTSMMQRHLIMPVETQGNIVTIGFVNEVNDSVLRRVQNFLPSMEVQPVSISLDFFELHIQQLQDSTVRTLSIPEKLRSLLDLVVAEGASDLHLCALLQPRWRVDGRINEISNTPALAIDEVYELLKPITPAVALAELDDQNDCDFAFTLDEHARFRVNMFRDDHGVGAVLRLIPSRIMTVGQLGLPPVILELAAQNNGLVLVTGATGSGKSTTLASMVNYLNTTKEAHIITLEDPIEFVHSSRRCLINQREIGTHTESFKRALKAALRQDPDIVLVGELRDRETIQLALEIANTGHLVFGTLHTMNAVGTIERIVDIFPAEQQSQIRSTLADVLKGVISQTLCQKSGGGRVAAIEVMVVNQGISNNIRRGNTHQIESLMQTGKALGNQLLTDSLASLVRKKTITFEEAIHHAPDKSSFAQLFNRRHLR